MEQKHDRESGTSCLRRALWQRKYLPADLKAVSRRLSSSIMISSEHPVETPQSRPPRDPEPQNWFSRFTIGLQERSDECNMSINAGIKK